MLPGWLPKLHGYWVAREKLSGRFLGEVGFADWKRHLDAAPAGAPELGYALAPWCHGQGFATEAVRAATAWADTHLRRPTWCLISPEAAASLRVATKCGYRAFKQTTYDNHSILLLARHPVTGDAPALTDTR